MADDAEEDLERLAEDWITLWQSEIAGWAADPEVVESLSAGAALWAAWLRMMSAAPARAARRGPLDSGESLPAGAARSTGPRMAAARAGSAGWRAAGATSRRPGA